MCMSNCFTAIIEKKNNVILIIILISSGSVKSSRYIGTRKWKKNNVLLERFAVGTTRHCYNTADIEK